MNEFEMMKKMLEREKEIFKITEVEGEGVEITIFNPQTRYVMAAVVMNFDENGQMKDCPYSTVLDKEDFEELVQQYRESAWYNPDIEQIWIIV